MPYQYGMQTSPSGGNGLGGLPKKQTTPKEVSFTRIVTAGSGTIVPPANAKYMRVAVIGPGGSGRDFCAGGGGGCAASKIVPAAPISYTVGAAVLFSVGTNGLGTPSVAVFPGYRLEATSGQSATTGGVLGPGGVGSGGDYNFSGGIGSSNESVAGGGGGGGGAAGPNGNGATFGSLGSFAGTGWGSGGGSGSIASGLNGINYGGGGSGAPGYLGSTGVWSGAYAASIFGSNPATVYVGGVMGGGGGSNGNAATYFAGGVGGIVVEWFYD